MTSNLPFTNGLISTLLLVILCQVTKDRKRKPMKFVSNRRYTPHIHALLEWCFKEVQTFMFDHLIHFVTL